MVLARVSFGGTVRSARFVPAEPGAVVEEDALRSEDDRWPRNPWVAGLTPLGRPGLRMCPAAEVGMARGVPGGPVIRFCSKSTRDTCVGPLISYYS
eukprot:5573602-Prymnesium_polylepis.1